MSITKNAIAVRYWGYNGCILQTVTLDSNHSCTIISLLYERNNAMRLQKMELCVGRKWHYNDHGYFDDFHISIHCIVAFRAQHCSSYSISCKT